MLENKLLLGLITWLGGILSAVLVQQILNRRSVLSYFVQHHKVGTSANDQIFGVVQITWNGAQVPNLYLSTVELLNESSRDLTNVKIKVFSNDTTLKNEFCPIVGTTLVARHSPEYQQAIAVQPGGQPTNDQWEVYGSKREYLLPVLNRGQQIKFQYLNTSKSDQQPSIWLEVVHAGVSVKYRHPHELVFGVARPQAALAGVLLGLLFAAFALVYVPYVWIIAFGCLIFGFIAQLPGAYAVRLLRWFRNAISG